MFMPQLLLHWKQYGCSISGKLRLIMMYNCIQDSFKNKKLNKTRKNKHPQRYLYWYSIKIKIKPHNLQGTTLALTPVAERDLKVNS